MKISTGWFGQPSKPEGNGRSTITHVRKDDGTCLCGYKPHKNYQYQWCFSGISMDYIECKGCREQAEKLLKIFNKEKYNEYLNRKISKNFRRTEINFM